jgi:hypothetical protein
MPRAWPTIGQAGDALTGQMSPIDAYLAAEYVVLDDEREIVARIDQANPDLDALLDARAARHGVFITAANPRSEVQSDAVNRAANDQMHRRLTERGFVALPHIGREPGSGWIEEGFFVLNLAPKDALDLAAQFDQFAIVVAEQGRMAELKFTVIGEASAQDPR